jgi:uncharacterized protein involved in exopolysaccharide biosynthesis
VVVDYLRAPFNHPWWMLVPFLLVVAVATLAAFATPKRYTTSCLVLVKVSRVPDKILTTVAEDLDARRHQTIRQEILSRTRLERVNDELHPYPDARTVTVALEAMQAATEVNFKSSDAFTIEFTHRDPQVATNVVNRIATLFIDEFRRSRQNQFEGATQFLDAELQEARRELDTKEEALRVYKERNMGRLPEQLPATLSSLQRLQLELQGVEATLDAAEARLERLTSRVAPDVPAAAPATEGNRSNSSSPGCACPYRAPRYRAGGALRSLEDSRRLTTCRRPGSDYRHSAQAGAGGVANLEARRGGRRSHRQQKRQADCASSGISPP